MVRRPRGDRAVPPLRAMGGIVVTAVLIIDDAPAVAASCAQALADAGHSVRAVTSVDDALVELAANGRPGAVVLDYTLDRGASALRSALVRLYRAEGAARAPVLVTSGLDDAEARTSAEVHGWHFLPKPFDDEALTAAVAALLTPSETTMPDDPQRATVARGPERSLVVAVMGVVSVTVVRRAATAAVRASSSKGFAR